MYPGIHAASRPDHPAYVMAESGEIVTYRQLDAAANRLSRALRAAGLGVGDSLAMMVENHPRFYEIVWAAHYAGLVYTPMSTRLTIEEVRYILQDCGAKVVVTSPAHAAVVSDASAGLDVILRIVLDGPEGQPSPAGYDRLADVVAGQSSEPLADRIEGADMLYSSGTTGRPKGVQTAFPSKPLGELGALNTATKGLFGVDEHTVYLSPAPLYHAAPLRFNISVQRAGGTSVIMEHFDAERYLGLIQQYRIDTSQVVPTMFVRLLKLPAEVRAAYDVSSLRVVIHAAAPCPVDVKRKMIDWFGPVLHEYYAGTEANGFVYCTSEEWLAHPGTVGRAILGTVHIVGEDGEDVATGETGLVYFAGGPEFVYHNDQAKTDDSRNAKGWTTLGDVGRLDADGYLYLTDRASFMIITGGVNVYPQEIENLLIMHDAVLDAAVFGIPDADFGEQVKAVVQLADPQQDHTGVEQQLLAYCREHLSPIKCPRSVDIIDELPRHATGKLYKRLLRDQYWGDRTSRIN